MSSPASPKLYMRCVHAQEMWWNEGEVYPVNDDGLVLDSGNGTTPCTWIPATLNDNDGEFKCFWLLPDGTELGAL